MSSIIACQCGAKVRLPAGRLGSDFRCPKCKTTLSTTTGFEVRAIRVDASTGAVCPICQTHIEPEQACVTCPSCQQIHHDECWSEIGGCGTYGCSEAPVIDKSEQSVQTPLTAWGDTKKCPACGETIKSIALRCRFCGTDFGSVDPLTAADLRKDVIDSQKIERFKRNIVVNFVLSLLGFLAPISLIFGLAFIVSKRQQLAKCGPIFVIMGWAAIGLSSIYCVLLIVFLMARGFR